MFSTKLLLSLLLSSLWRSYGIWTDKLGARETVVLFRGHSRVARLEESVLSNCLFSTLFCLKVLSFFFFLVRKARYIWMLFSWVQYQLCPWGQTSFHRFVWFSGLQIVFHHMFEGDARSVLALVHSCSCNVDMDKHQNDITIYIDYGGWIYANMVLLIVVYYVKICKLPVRFKAGRLFGPKSHRQNVTTPA